MPEREACRRLLVSPCGFARCYGQVCCCVQKCCNKRSRSSDAKAADLALPGTNKHEVQQHTYVPGTSGRETLALARRAVEKVCQTEIAVVCVGLQEQTKRWLDACHGEQTLCHSFAAAAIRSSEHKAVNKRGFHLSLPRVPLAAELPGALPRVLSAAELP